MIYRSTDNWNVYYSFQGPKHSKMLLAKMSTELFQWYLSKRNLTSYTALRVGLGTDYTVISLFAQIITQPTNLNIPPLAYSKFDKIAKHYSPWGRTSCEQWVAGWRCSSWPPCTSHCRLLWCGTCPRNEAITSPRDAPLRTVTSRGKQRKDESSIICHLRNMSMAKHEAHVGVDLKTWLNLSKLYIIYDFFMWTNHNRRVRLKMTSMTSFSLH